LRRAGGTKGRLGNMVREQSCRFGRPGSFGGGEAEEDSSPAAEAVAQRGVD
jgi:hypothetical protein